MPGKRGATEWIPIEQPPAEILTLLLVLLSQAMDEPDPCLPSVAVAAGKDTVYQVKDDAQLMQDTHADGVDLLASDCFKTAHMLADLTPD